MIDYRTFAITLSLLAIVLVTLAGVVSRWRAYREGWTENERRTPRMAILSLWAIAVATLLSALVIDQPDYADVTHLALSFIRGVLIGVGGYLLALYWYHPMYRGQRHARGNEQRPHFHRRRSDPPR